MHARRQGFTLIELMIVVTIIAIIAAIAIPNLISARKAGNEASAISALRTLATVSETYRARFLRYPGNLSDLETTGYIDSLLGSGVKSGFSFTYAGSPDVWSCNADPTIPGTTGDRYFFVNNSGVIRFSSTGTASAASPPID